MSVQPFLIASPKVGLERDLEPWLIPSDAYPDLEDCYLWRGRIKRRQCYSLLGRLNWQIGTTAIDGTFATTVPGFPSTQVLLPAVSQFQIGTQIFQDPDPIISDDPVDLLTNSTSLTASTLDRSTGAVSLNTGPVLADTAVFYYPGLPVMGLAALESTTFGAENIDTLVAFDTRFAYLNVNATNPFVALNFYRGTATVFNWTGTDSQFFWTTNYAGAMWATNNNPGFQPAPLATTPDGGDGIRWLDMDQTGWVNFLPPIDSVNRLMGCLIILPYKGRLICLNTTEGTAIGGLTVQRNFAQRARWSQNGNPFYTTPIPTYYPIQVASPTAWRSDITGRGGFIDAPTLEQIISAEFVYDALVVYFERSTWQLAYTGDELLPFIWVRINTELGAQSPFSIIPLDHTAIAFGNVGIHQCDSIDVKRIDQRIPDEVFNVQNANQGPKRVCGIRDYFNQLLYWTMPYLGQNSENEWQTDGQAIIYPNKILVYNYVEGSYSFFNDSFTTFGYYQPQSSLTWSSTLTWASELPWVSPVEQSEFQNIVAGNQQGYVEILNQNDFNSPSLFISNITPGTPSTTIISPNHNIQAGDFIQINAPTATTGITGLDQVIYQVALVIDANTFTIPTPVAPTGVYIGQAQITTVNQLSILTKRFNPYIAEGSQIRLNYADLYFENDPNGQVTVNLYINEDSTTPVNSLPTTAPISSVSSTITAITATNPAVITVTNASSFHLNDVIFINGVLGMIQINNLGIVVTNITGNNITIDLDASTFSVYTSGGIAWDISQNTGNFVNLFPETTYTNSPDTNFGNSKLWKRIYFDNISQLFQLQITLSPNQMMAQPIVESNNTLHGMILWFSKAGRLINI